MCDIRPPVGVQQSKARIAAEACVAGRHQAQQRGIFIQSVCPSRFPCGRWQCEQLPRGRSCAWIVRLIEAEPVPNCCDGVRGTWRGPGGLPGTFPRPRLSGSVAVPIAAAGICWPRRCGRCSLPSSARRPAGCLTASWPGPGSRSGLRHVPCCDAVQQSLRITLPPRARHSFGGCWSGVVHGRVLGGC